MKNPSVPGLDVCPACGHAAENHPLDERTGDRYCSRSLTEPPSCSVCRGNLEALFAARVEVSQTHQEPT